MKTWSMWKPSLSFVAGVVAGLLFGAGVLVGVRNAGWLTQSAAPLPDVLLRASATHGGDTMAMATGPIANGVEGVFFLDYLTGELVCNVIEPRTLGPGGIYKTNVVADLGIVPGKSPKYLLATGAADIRTATTSNVQFAQSLVYVCEANTGVWAAYALPWNKAMASFRATQVANMTKVAGGKSRIDVVRD